MVFPPEMALFFAVGLIFPRQVLSLMVIGNNQAEEILDVAEEYIRLMSIIGIPMMISTIIASSLREIGRVKPPLAISIAATLINTFFNWVLIYGNLGAPRLEIRGAAYATIIARIVEMILFVGSETQQGDHGLSVFHMKVMENTKHITRIS